MKEIKIKCPTCGKILRLADNPNINNAVFTCPVCKEKHVVGNCQRIVGAPIQNIADEETQYFFPSRSISGDETQIAESLKQQSGMGEFVDDYGRTYKLHLGVSTIGRKASSSVAAIQITTEDRYMSRNHAVIEVKNAGGKIIHILRHGAGKNSSYINGTIMQAKDQFVLNNGDRLTFGKTELTFKCPL